MDVIVTGRHCHISDEFREEIVDKLGGIEKFRGRVQRIDVQITAGEGKHKEAVTAEITLIGKGPVVRAEGTSEDKHVAFDLAFEKLRTQVRRAADRRKQHKGLRGPGLLEMAAEQPRQLEEDKPTRQTLPGGLEVEGDGPLVMREKEFTAAPLTLAQALDEMELVGHDFFLYVDAETRKPSVVYRRKGYDYGVIHLTTAEQ